MNKAKLYIKRTISIIILIGLPLIFNIYTQFRFDVDTQRIEAYYLEEPNSIDVILLGASDVYTGYSPSYAYEKYGYTSYNYAIALNHIDLYISQLKEVYSTQTPKLVLIEITPALGIDKETEDSKKTTIHRMIDAMPDSSNKNYLIASFDSLEDRMSCYYPFIMYHGVGNMIETNRNRICFNSKKQNYLKGIYAQIADYEWDNNYQSVIGDNSVCVPPQSCIDKLNNMIDYCKAERIPVVFARFPHRITKNKYLRYQYGNYIKNMIIQRGFDFIDFEDTVEQRFEYNTDFSDGEHLNGIGQRKLTEYLGQILNEQYGIQRSELSEEAKMKWDDSAMYTKLFYEYYDTLKQTPNEQLKLKYGVEHLWENKELIDQMEKHQK